MKHAITHSALLLGALACADGTTAPGPEPFNPYGQRSAGWMSATTESDPWNTVFVTARREDGYLFMEGTQWEIDETQIVIRLTLRTDIGTEPQVIGPGTPISADVMYRPMHDYPKGWTASRALGSGSVTLTSITSDRATGTFSFTAAALGAGASPPTFRVTNGLFDVRF